MTDDQMENQAAKEKPWMRGLYMLLLMLALGVAHTLVNLTAVVQFLWLLFTAAPNALLQHFGRSLSIWIAETVVFLSCVSEEKPFPWKAWPASDSTLPSDGTGLHHS